MTRKIKILWELPQRKIITLLSVILGCLFIIIMSFTIMDTKAGEILLDSKSMLFPYPFTIQNGMLIMFFIGLGELFIRWRIAVRELNFIKLGILPEDEETVLQSHQLGAIRQKVAGRFDGDHGFLPGLVELIILQFHSSRSIDQAVSVLNSQLDLISHKVDLRYSMLRYIVWLVPTVGFIGTVIGISESLAKIDPSNLDFTAITQSLSVAFNTTLLALILSAILVFLLHVAQNIEERAVNSAGNYTLLNLVNRLYVGESK